MQIPEAEGRLFHELHAGLQLLVNRRYRVVDPVESVESFMALPPEHRIKTRNALYEHPECFDAFLEETDLSHIPDAAKIVTGWRDHRVAGDFYILRHLKRHTVFLSWSDPPRAFGVLGLVDPLERFVPHPPAMATAVLLPLRGRIIYDGFLLTPGPMIVFGGGIRRALEDSFREAKARSGGVITSLPHEVDRAGASGAGQARRRLKTLLSSERSRELNWEEILALRGSSPELEQAYHEEIGKVDARRIGRRLRAAGVTRGWFALYEGMVIASAAEREDLVRRIREVLPPARSHLPYLYQLRSRK